MANFLPAFAFILLLEGGYVNDPDDHETKYGIAKHSYPDIDIASLTLDDAHDIYLRDFWKPLHLGQIGDQRIANEVMEQAVHMGNAAAGTILQTALFILGADIRIDGAIGPKTLEATNQYRDTESLLKMLNAQQIIYYMDLIKRKPKMKKYIRGWLRRVQL